MKTSATQEMTDTVNTIIQNDCRITVNIASTFDISVVSLDSSIKNQLDYQKIGTLHFTNSNGQTQTDMPVHCW